MYRLRRQRTRIPRKMKAAMTPRAVEAPLDNPPLEVLRLALLPVLMTPLADPESEGNESLAWTSVPVAEWDDVSIPESPEFGLGLMLAGTEGFTALLLMRVGADAAFAGARVPLAIDVLPPPGDGNEGLDADVGGPPGLGFALGGPDPPV
jgi:hypothetical protein